MSTLEHHLVFEVKDTLVAACSPRRLLHTMAAGSNILSRGCAIINIYLLSTGQGTQPIMKMGVLLYASLAELCT